MHFVLGTENFAIPLSYILEIQTPPPFTPIPRTESWLQGVINLRGEILSVVDIRRLLNCGAPPPGAAMRLLIVECSIYRLAMLVDSVMDIVDIDPSEIIRSEDISKAENPAILGVHTRAGVLISLLDPEALLAGPELQVYL